LSRFFTFLTFLFFFERFLHLWVQPVLECVDGGALTTAYGSLSGINDTL